MASEYIFARHGESTVNLSRTISNRVSDIAPLTERGRRQAQELLASLQTRRVIAVYASPLMRARETGEILTAGLGLPLHIADALREPDCGILEGRSDAGAWWMHAAQEQAWKSGQLNYQLPGGESLNTVRQRFVPFIQQMIVRHQQDTGSVLLVSHGSVLINMLPLVSANLNPDFASTHGLRNCGCILAAPSGPGLACLDWDGISLPTI